VPSLSPLPSRLPFPIAPKLVQLTLARTLSYGIHTPSAPASLAVTAPAPYPTGSAATPVVPTGTGVSTPLASEIGTAAPSGTGAYSAPPSEFTGAASHVKVGGFVAGVGAVAALFL
jgi:hypothetical protein